MTKIILDNPKITSFYENNPDINCEKVNLFVIEMMNNLQRDSTIANNNNSNIISSRDELKEVISKCCHDITLKNRQQNHEEVKEAFANFDLKSSMMFHNMQQPIYSFISNSEERINKNISAIKESQKSNNSDEYNMLLNDITNIVGSKQTCHGNKTLRNTFNKLYTSAEVRNVEICDVDEAVTMKRFRCPDIFIQLTKNEDNIYSEQLDQLYRNVSEYNYSGIIVSQSGGFSGKDDFHIDIHNNQIIVFIHNYKDNDLKLQMAVNIIDNLMKHINPAKMPNDATVNISKEILEKINNEYRLFISQKTAVVDILKDTQKKVISQMDEIKFPFLEKYLSTKFVAPVCNSGLKCDVCKNYSANNLKALAAHKRGCLRKHPHYSKGGKPMNCDKENITNCM